MGVPLIRESDASLGVANQVEQRKGDVATALPSSLATAATFDPAIARAGGAMIGAEARAKRFTVLLAGGVNLTRDPWNGRNFEYLGEDPLLAGTMAGAHIAGVQSNKIVSTIKHYALNDQETDRNAGNSVLDHSAARVSDLLAFQLAIERADPGSIMCSYNRVDSVYACENSWLL
ncbi:glycoside hydrolase family 3 N-terminal domain-containing protein, partial [Pseudomonas sp. EA_65y_Pfl1_P113]|uniref:glycoside hydrolase family 3 N-terminal domain-containing protein n=1 Tax=Pseudomonas sp. EA_65y_Pfl1_P113 TaxID=3088692 RepID=UPI0030D81FD1